MKTTTMAGVACLILTLAVMWVESAPPSYNFDSFAAKLRNKRQTDDTATATTIPNCLAELDWPLVCETCPMYTVMAADLSTCLNCDTSCATCMENAALDGSTDCMSCMTGYIMEQDPNQGNKSVCFGCASFCDKCSVRSECDNDGCVAKSNGQGTVFSDEDKTCKSCASNCKSCTVAGECSANSCFDGYALSSTSTCDACPDFALTCSYTGELRNAKTCIDGYAIKPSSGTTAASCEECPENCNACAWSTDNSRTSCNAGSCADRFVRQDDGKCSACASDCEECSVAGKCDDGKCKSGFGYYKEACVECPTKCLSCTPDPDTGAADTCDQCMETYMLSDLPTCDFCPSNCHTCQVNGDGDPVCKNSGCDSGYAYRSPGTCEKCPDNCDSCQWSSNDRTECLSCVAKYAKGKSGQCFPCPDNCDQCKDNADGDTYCEYNYCAARSTYKAVDKSCPSCPDNCHTCYVDQSEIIKCTDCDAGFTRSTDWMACEACPDNCNMCGIDATSGNTVCYDQQCKTSFYRDEDGECERCSDGCARCDKDQCFECSANYVMDSSASPAVCHSCSNCVGTCTYTNSRAECSQCAEGYMLDNSGRCKSCPTGCKTCSEDGDQSTCDDTGCKIGFVQVTADSCVACPPGCKVCSYSGSNTLTCDVSSSSPCMSGYTYAQSQCLPCPADCDDCSHTYSSSASEMECTNCSPGYAEVDGLCKPCQSGCMMCDTNGAGNCDSGSCPTSTLYNSDTTQCDDCATNCKNCLTAEMCDGASATCATGYYKKDDSCIKCDLNCNSCSETECSVCEYGYALDSLDTTSCVKCDGGCEFCTVVNGNPVCDWGQCKAEYVMSDDRNCNACPLGCAACKWDGSKAVCAGQCKTGYVLKTDGTCEKCPNNCLHCKYDGSTTKCYEEGCMDNYRQGDDGSCESETCDENCDSGCTSSGDTKCDSKCKDKFYLDPTTKTCIACGDSTTCKTCTSDGVCLSCPNENEAIISDVCTACGANCVPANGCTTADKCDAVNAQCEDGFYHDTDVCTVCATSTDDECNVNSCKACSVCTSGTQCTTCPAGSNKATSTACVACSDTECSTCATYDECTACLAGKGHLDGASDGACTACVDTNCEECGDNNKKCTACTSGKRLADADCPSDTCCEDCEDTNCEKCDDSASTCTRCKSDVADVMLSGGKCRTMCTTTAAQRVKETATDTYECIDAGDTGCMVAFHSLSSGAAEDRCQENLCKEGYVFNPSTDKCTECPTGCRSCALDAAGAAFCLFSSCEEGYGRESNGECSRCPVGCDRCSWDSASSSLMCDTDQCSAAYVVVEALECVKCHLGCEQCSMDSLNRVQCQTAQCSDKYVQMQTDDMALCFPCSRYCDQCTFRFIDPINTALTGTSMATCNSNQCQSSYAMNPDTTACITCPDSCDECSYSSGKTLCNVEKCKSGHAQDPVSRDCKACPEYCDVCIWDTSATNNVRCLDGGCQAGSMETRDSSDTLECELCLDDCWYCETDPASSTDTICLDQQCATGYGLTADYNCEACVTGCLWCEIDDEGQQTCTSCGPGYVLNAGSCMACPDNCLLCTYDSVNEISVCASSGCVPLFAQNSQTDDKGCEACPERCSQCTYSSEDGGTVCQSGKCDLESGYAVTTDGACGECASNCLTCSTNGAEQCDTCGSGYRLNSEKTCDACSSHCTKCSSAGAGKCDSNSCDARYVLDSELKECLACADNCEFCNSKGAGKCDKNRCDDFYAWDETSELCIKCPDNCEECIVGEEGTECIEGKCMDEYGLKDSDKKCHACPSECITCTDNKDEMDSYTGNLKCTACKNYFILNGEQCGSCPINCAVCNYETGYGMRCSSCLSMHAMDPDKNCLPCPSQCSECSYDSGTTKCMAGMCAEGYAMAADGSCKSCSELTYSNCASCTDITGNGTANSVCMECKADYTKQDDDTACLACPSSCGTCIDKAGKYCETCDESTLRSNSKEVCGVACHQCDSEDEGCDTSTSGAGTTVCNSCWAWGEQNDDKTVRSFGRGCSNLTCAGDYLDRFCKNTGNVNRCDRCCTGTNCNTFNIIDLLNSAADVKPSIFVLLGMALAVLGRTM